MLLWMVRLLLLLLLLLVLVLLMKLMLLLLHLLELHLLLPQIVLMVEAHEKLLCLDELGVVRRCIVLLHLLEFLQASLVSIVISPSENNKAATATYLIYISDLLLGQIGGQCWQTSARVLHRARRLNRSHHGVAMV